MGSLIKGLSEVVVRSLLGIVKSSGCHFETVVCFHQHDTFWCAAREFEVIMIEDRANVTHSILG